MEQNYSNPERSLPGDTDSDFQLSQELNKSTDDRFNLSLSLINKGKEKQHQEQLHNPEKYALETLRMTPTQFERYRNAFGLFDLSDTGKISKVEFERAIGFFGLAKDISQRELAENFLLLDRNNDRYFTIFDFLREMNNQNMFRFLVRIVKTVLAKDEEIRAYKSESAATKELSEIKEVPKGESDEFSYEPLLSNPKAYASSILKMDDNEFDRCKQAFEMLDENNEGYVTKDSFSEHLANYHFGKNLTKAEYNYMFSKIESELRGEFNFLDFLKVMKKDTHSLFRKLVDHLNKRLEPFESIKSYDMKENLVHEDEKTALSYARDVLKMEEGEMNKLIKLFRALDMNQQSFISPEDLDAVLTNTSLNKALNLNEFQELFRELDLDRDGKISLKDFFRSISDNNFSIKSTDFLNEMFSHFDKSLKLERRREELSRSEPEEELEEEVVESGRFERRREEAVEVEPEAELEIEIMKEAKMDEKLESAGALNEELHRRLLTVDHDISVFNEHMERDLRVVEERYKADLELLKNNLIQKEHLLREKDLFIESLKKENHGLKTSNQGLEARMGQYEEEIAAMQKAHELFVKDRDQEVVKLQQLQEEISNLLRDNESKTNEIERLDQEIRNWKTITSEKSGSSSEDLINNIEFLNNQIQILIKEKNEIEEEKRVLMTRGESLEKERTQLFEDLSEVKKDIEIVYKDEDERRQQIEELCKQVQESVSADKYKALLKERDTLAAGASSGEKEILETRIRELERDRNQLRETCDKVNQDLQTIVNDIDNFEERERGYLSQIEDLNRQVGGIDLLRKEMNDLREENEMLSSRVEQLQQVAMNETNQERMRSHGLVKELNEFEGSLKRLQKREDDYNQQIGALSEDLGKYTIDTEKLRLDNSILQDQVASLSEEVSQTRAKLAQMHDLNKRLTNESSSLSVELSRLREARNRTGLEMDALVNSEHRLKEDVEKIKLEFQSLKIRNLVLEDKVEILERERARLDELNKRLGQKHLLDYTAAETESDQLKRQIREVKTDNIHLREQIDQMREKYERHGGTPMKSSNRVLQERDKENMTPNRGSYQKDKGYLNAIEKLKDELKHVRESREAILDSLEKERVSIRDAIEDSTRARLSFSNRKTPLKEQEKEFAHTMTQEHPHEPTARKSGFIHLTTHSAPETIKKTVGGVRQMPSLSGQKDSSRKSSAEVNLHEERVRDISKFAFQILYWLTDDALITKELASVCSFAEDDQVGLDIKRVMKEVHEFAERAKSYYNQYILSKTDDEIRAVYEFILPLFNKCYKSHCELKEIQNRAVNDLKSFRQHPSY